MEILTGGLFIGAVALFFLIHTRISDRSSADRLILTILSVLITALAIGAGLNDTELLQDWQGSIVLIGEAIIGLLTLPKLFYVCGVDE